MLCILQYNWNTLMASSFAGVFGAGASDPRRKRTLIAWERAAMLECVNCGAIGDAYFSVNHVGEVVCELCGTQSFQESRNETQDMEDMTVDFTQQVKTLEKIRSKKRRRVSHDQKVQKTGKQAENETTLTNCLQAVQYVLEHQANALIKDLDFPKEYAVVVQHIWFRFLDAWGCKSDKPLLTCFTEIDTLRLRRKRLTGDQRPNPIAPSDVQDDLLAEWDELFIGSQNSAKECDGGIDSIHIDDTLSHQERSTLLPKSWSKLEHFSLATLLGILYLSSRILHTGVLPNDFTYWIKEGKLPYHNLLAKCPQKLTCLIDDAALFFDTNVWFSQTFNAAKISFHANYLQHHLELHLPPLNSSMAAHHICLNLGFPPGVFQNFQWLIGHLSVPDKAVCFSDDNENECLCSSAEIAAHLIVAVRMCPNWHKWIYEHVHASNSFPVRFQEAVTSFPREQLNSFLDFSQQALLKSRNTPPPHFDDHVSSLRSIYGALKGKCDVENQPQLHPLRAYFGQFERGVCIDSDAVIEQVCRRSKKEKTAFFYPYYSGVLRDCYHAPYEHLLSLLCEYIDASIDLVKPHIKRVDSAIYRSTNDLMTTCAQAIKNWEAKNSAVAEDAIAIKLYCQLPPINKLDTSLNALKNCEHLSLSTNCIDRFIPLSGMKKLRILSLGRNQIKKIEKLDDFAETLEELWLSYNLIATLDGLSGLTHLTTLYVSNNQIKNWEELDKLAALPKLRDVLFTGNPIYENLSKEEQRLNVLTRIPQVAKIDGDMVKQNERDAVSGQ
ncbi:hypothetical protein ABG067_004885 [Albugo candida]